MSLPAQDRMVDPAIFDELQAKMDEDSQVRDELKDILQTLQRQGSSLVQLHLPDRKANTIDIQAGVLKLFFRELIQVPQTSVRECGCAETLEETVSSVVADARKSISAQMETITNLSKSASRYPYYKYNSLWARNIENTCFHILFCAWLGGYKDDFPSAGQGRLLTIEEMGTVLNIPVNLKDRDEFHLTIEEYLLALISLIDELARLAVNSVTLGEYGRPQMISQFMKDLHAGFQLLNLKNDLLRKRADSVKWNVKKVEDVLYDLSLRNLVPKKEEAAPAS
ncbi:MAG: hypothetical protein M1834_005592 [Cirrosporium novae-zelandiae]|nr:MAG: hypothetical protein M1834_005592 [Cirrosporium novae-zelandiae]